MGYRSGQPARASRSGDRRPGFVPGLDEASQRARAACSSIEPPR